MSIQAVTKISQFLFAVPDSGQDEYRRLPEDVQNDVDRLLIEFEKVHAERYVRPALKRLAPSCSGIAVGLPFGASCATNIISTPTAAKKRPAESFQCQATGAA